MLSRRPDNNRILNAPASAGTLHCRLLRSCQKCARNRDTGSAWVASGLAVAQSPRNSQGQEIESEGGHRSGFRNFGIRTGVHTEVDMTAKVLAVSLVEEGHGVRSFGRESSGQAGLTVRFEAST